MASKKTQTKKTKKRKASAKVKPIVPPTDDPKRRYLELSADRRFGSEDEALSKLRLSALKEARRKRAAEGVAPTPAAPGISNWAPLGPTAIPEGQTYGGARVLVTGRVAAIATHPTDPLTIYIGAARGGVWKSEDGGVSWTPKSDNEVSLAIGALALLPSNPQVIYAGSGEGNLLRYVQAFPLDSSPDNYMGNGVLKSLDGGNTWTQQGAAQFIGAAFFRIAAHQSNPDMAYAATSAGLFRTTNGGASWTQLTNGLPSISGTIIAATDVVIDPSAPNTVYTAFWGDGVYKTTSGASANPSWTKQTSGLPGGSLGRIALAIAPSAPSKVYALFANGSEGVRGLFETTASGWGQVTVSLTGVGGATSYNFNLAVDPMTPDILYLSDTSLFKLMRNPVTGVWSIADIGLNIHADNHAFAFHPTNHLIIFAGNDGGIYKSLDGGMTWDDRINFGLCLTQYEFIDQHPTSDAVVFGGTQDNGTEQFRNSPVFYHTADGDGGFVIVDYAQPRNVLHTYYSETPERSTLGGLFGEFTSTTHLNWTDVSAGLAGNGLFYPPMTLDQANANNIAFGTDRINLDTAQGAGGWPTKVTLPGISGRVSAISYVNANLIYCATSAGRVYKLSKSGATWTATTISASPLPSRWVWDVSPLPGDVNTVIVVMAGFGAPHVWRGTIPASGAGAWTDISGTGAGRLPDIPVNALVIEPATPTTMYIGTDVGVFRTTDAGSTWSLFSDGLPNVAVYDLKLHAPTRLLRAGTHGRGLWERKLDVTSGAGVDLYVRDHLMDTARTQPTPGAVAAFEDALQHVALGDTLFWYQCADIKIDALEGMPLSYQMDVAAVDYVAFESELEHRNPQRGRVNRVYAQVHNRGVQTATNLTVKILFADASAGLPPLPADFWTAFPGDSADTSVWRPIGAAQLVPSVSPTEPTVLEWDWNTPVTAADHSCLLIVVDSAEDPIPAANKVFDIGALVTNEKRVGLKNLHVVNAAPGSFYWTPFWFHGNAELRHLIRFGKTRGRRWQIGLLFPLQSQTDLQLDGLRKVRPTQAMITALRQRLGDEITKYDTTALYTVSDVSKGGSLGNVKVPSKGLKAMLLLTPPSSVGAPDAVSITQEAQQRLVGGSTFVLRTVRRR